jgi:hypothetical protein
MVINEGLADVKYKRLNATGNTRFAGFSNCAWKSRNTLAYIKRAFTGQHKFIATTTTTLKDTGQFI